MEGNFFQDQSFIIGREGHIYIGDPSVSKYHAEISVSRQGIYLKDLDSTNGTYLVRNSQLIHFREGYVNIEQKVFIGSRQYSIKDLLDIVSIFNTDIEQPDSFTAAV